MVLKIFIFKILESNIPNDKISDIECEYIQKYNSILPYDYNADLGGVEYYKHSEEIKQKIAESGKGNKNSKYVADILMYDKNGKLLMRFQSAREASRFLGKESKNVGINYCLNGKQKQCMDIYGNMIKIKNLYRLSLMNVWE